MQNTCLSLSQVLPEIQAYDRAASTYSALKGGINGLASGDLPPALQNSKKKSSKGKSSKSKHKDGKKRKQKSNHHEKEPVADTGASVSGDLLGDLMGTPSDDMDASGPTAAGNASFDADFLSV
eukprot:SAG31_NODE_999_length_10457_cov_3.482622_13_plen_123_part_00